MTGADATSGKTGDDVDKIRDIIFGTQMREYAARFAEMEAVVAAKLERMAKEFEQRFDGLERAVRERADQLKRELDTEASRRADEVADAKRQLGSSLERSQAEVTTLLRAESDRLEQRKVTSEDLARLFSELSRQLTQNGQ
jgi:hypothetical protein